ncbi:MAG: cobyrinate a,c-diamide synthase [Eubacteriales bacterium]|nr:cobyrinate a,c-diamide synthase [Eubacteriales bacterium]
MNQRLLIAATSSDCGKTTLTLALLAALKARGIPLLSYKSGPDYIDPAFHRQALGIESYNLDPFFLDSDGLCQMLDLAHDRLAIMEGAMGYYDGIGLEGKCSSYELAQATHTPVILLINGKKLYQSVAAMAQGYRDFRLDSRIKGVILNRIKPYLYPGMSAMLAQVGIKTYGFLPELPEAELASSYLGLKQPTDEKWSRVLRSLAAAAEEYLDLDGLLELANSAPELRYQKREMEPLGSFKLAVARDAAFCFLYPENILLLEKMGAEVSYFSPLAGDTLMEDIDALYLPGGYPEQYAKELAASASRFILKEALEQGMPCIAEGGGFLYLQEKLQGQPMVGFLEGSSELTDHLQGFGYHYIEPREIGAYLLGQAGQPFPAHCFHYCRTDGPGQDYSYRRAASGKSKFSGYGGIRLYSGMAHLYFPAMLNEISNFARQALAYQTEKQN